MKKILRSGYTTGACAAAAAKAAALLLTQRNRGITEVDIPFPDGSRHTFRINGSGVRDQGISAWASVVKDAGDDPDVTNGTEIMAEAKLLGPEAGGQQAEKTLIKIKGGKGVGIVTKPGLSVPVGEPAINPVPREMIHTAVEEAVAEGPRARGQGSFEIIISVPKGEELAKKTLNHRLGIVGGISILGTTGIVRPISADAWTATISSAMDVARAMGRDSIVLSAGRTSEKAHMKKYTLPEELYVLMGDHLEYSLLEAKRHGFRKIHLCAQWAKMLKIAMATPQTHVKFGAIDVEKAVAFLGNLGFRPPDPAHWCFNTAREIYDIVPPSLFSDVCAEARRYAGTISGGIPVTAHLVSYEGEIIANSE